MNRTSQRKLATIISRVFDPFVSMGGVSVLAVLRSGLTGWPLYLFLFGIVIATIVLLVTLLHWALRKGHLTNWDLSNRRERLIPLAVALGVLVFDLVNARFFINDFLVDLFTLYIFFLIGFFLISLFWKISGHSSSITLAIGLLLTWYGWGLWPLLIVIPLMGWSRVVRRDHTILQVIAGVLYSSVILLYFYW